MADVLSPLAGTELEHELERMLDIERFEPPDAFRRTALLNDPSVYERAAADPEAWWAEQAGALDWAQPWTQVLDWSHPPFAKWFLGGRLNACHNCLDRHVEAGLGGRVAYHWHGCATRSGSQTCSSIAASAPGTSSASICR